jgi:hypothetical protein
MWFVYVVLIAAVLVSALVLGSATYLEHVAASRTATTGSVPLPVPRPKKVVRVSAPDEEPVTVPKHAEKLVKPQRRSKVSRQATW